jgi:hypothetical protein
MMKQGRKLPAVALAVAGEHRLPDGGNTGMAGLPLAGFAEPGNKRVDYGCDSTPPLASGW